MKRLCLSTLVATLALIPVAHAGIGEIEIEVHENEALLGVYVEDEADPEGGARVTGTVEDGAAEAAGLRRGDIIVEVGGSAVRDHEGLGRLVRSHAPGDRVEVLVLRDGAEESFSFEMGERAPSITIEIDRPLHVVSGDMQGRVHGTMSLGGESSLEKVFVCAEGDDCKFSPDPVWYRLDCVDERCPTYRVNYWKRPMLGVQIVDITDELRVHFGADEDAGLLISKVYAGSPAERAGVETGDVIVAIDGETIDSASDIREALEGKSGRTVDVEVIHDGRAVSLVAEIPDYDF